jgi:hypothetical protein
MLVKFVWGVSCYSYRPFPVAERYKLQLQIDDKTRFRMPVASLPSLPALRSPRLVGDAGYFTIAQRMAFLLLTSFPKGITMSRTQWLFLGAVLTGVAVAIYFIFFCPSDCH